VGKRSWSHNIDCVKLGDWGVTFLGGWWTSSDYRCNVLESIVEVSPDSGQF